MQRRRGTERAQSQPVSGKRLGKLKLSKRKGKRQATNMYMLSLGASGTMSPVHTGKSFAATVPSKRLSPLRDGGVLHKMAGHRSFIEEIKSRPSYIEHKAALKDGNNVKPNKVEKWSHAEHQKHVKESERVYSLVQMERHALHLHQKVTDIMANVKENFEEDSLQQLGHVVQVFGVQRGLPETHARMQQAQAAITKLRGILHRRAELRRVRNETALFEAVEKADLDAIARLVIEEETNINATNAHGKNPIEVAALQRNLEVVRELASHGAHLNDVPSNSASLGAESDVVDSSHHRGRIVTELVANLPAKVDEADGEYIKVVDIVSTLLECGATQELDHTMPSALALSVDRQYRKIINTLCADRSVGRVVNEPFRGQPCMCHAASRGDIETLRALLRARADVNRTNDEGQTPIFIAAASNHAESVYYLAAAKADLSIPGSVTDTSVLSKPTSPVNAAFSAAIEKNLRLTPIDIAAKHGHLLVVKILLETFANAKRQARSGTGQDQPAVRVNNNSQPPLEPQLHKPLADIARNSCQPTTGAATVQIAQVASRAKGTTLKRHKSWQKLRSLISPGSFLRFRRKKKEVKDVAARMVVLSGVLKMVHLAREAKSRVRLQAESAKLRPKKDGKFVSFVKMVFARIKTGYNSMTGKSLMTAIAAAVNKELANEHLSAITSRVKMLLSAMAAPIDCYDSRGKTPLYHASARGATAICSLLLSRKAEVMMRARNGYTPLAIAAKNGHWNVVHILCARTLKLAKKYAKEPSTVDADGNPLPRRVIEHGPVSPLLEAVCSFRNNAHGPDCVAGVKMILKTLAKVGDLYEDVFWGALNAAVLLCRWPIVKFLMTWSSTCPQTLTQTRVEACRKQAEALWYRIHEASFPHLLNLQLRARRGSHLHLLKQDVRAEEAWHQLEQCTSNRSALSYDVNNDFILGKGYPDAELSSSDEEEEGDRDTSWPSVADGDQKTLKQQPKLIVGVGAISVWLQNLVNVGAKKHFLLKERFGPSFDNLAALCYASLTKAGSRTASVKRSTFLMWFADFFETHVLHTVVKVDRLMPRFVKHVGLREAAARALEAGNTGLVGSLEDLHTAVQQDDAMGILSLVCRAGVGVDTTPADIADTPQRHFAIDGSDDTYYTPLMVAVCYDNPTAVETLLHLKANPNHQADDGCTPLILACYQNHTKALKAMLDVCAATAKLEHKIQRDKHGALLDLKLCLPGGISPFALAVQEGHEETVRMLLDCRSSGAVDDAVVNFVSDDGATPLTLAMQNFHEPVLRLICEAVDINMPDPAGWSPLMTAVHTGDTKVLAVLLECKADPNVGHADSESNLVFTAVMANDANMLKLLLDAGAVAGKPEPVGGNTDAMTAAFCFHVEALVELHAHDMLNYQQRNHSGETVNDILNFYHHRKSVDELLTLNRSTTLARFAEHNLSEARDLFLRHSAGSEEASYVQFMVLLAALGLKEVYGDAFDSFAATAFQRLDRNSGSAQVRCQDFVDHFEDFTFIVAARKEVDGSFVPQASATLHAQVEDIRAKEEVIARQANGVLVEPQDAAEPAAQTGGDAQRHSEGV